MTARVKALRDADPGNTLPVPVDLVTASGSGLDPHISPAAAEYQLPRIARIRRIDPDKLRRLVAEHTQERQLGVLGEPVVNVLALNLALDDLKPGQLSRSLFSTIRAPPAQAAAASGNLSSKTHGGDSMNTIRNAMLAVTMAPVVGLGGRAVAPTRGRFAAHLHGECGPGQRLPLPRHQPELQDPAIQGGFDYAHASGVYLGTWGSSVSGNQYLGGNGMEWDLYGGYTQALGRREPRRRPAVLLLRRLPGFRPPIRRRDGEVRHRGGRRGSELEMADAEVFLRADGFLRRAAKHLWRVCNGMAPTGSGAASGDSERSGYLDLGASDAR